MKEPFLAPLCTSCVLRASWMIKSMSDVWRPYQVFFLRLGRAGGRRAVEMSLVDSSSVVVNDDTDRWW